MSVFNVELKKVVDDSYEIEVGHDLEQKLISDIKNGLVGGIKKFAVVTDSNVKELYAEKICGLLEESGYKWDLIVFPAGETSKTRETKEFIEDSMLEKGYRRDCCIIAVGGGVVTDIAGFVAGTYGRGVPFINYATTLLAAADASVGGKTAVDTPLATNLIGMFNQPEKVYIDISAWRLRLSSTPALQAAISSTISVRIWTGYSPSTTMPAVISPLRTAASSTAWS